MDINQNKSDKNIVFPGNGKVSRYSSDFFKKGLDLAKRIDKPSVNNRFQDWFEHGKSLYDLGKYDD
jgi:hypothetical protein